MAATSFNDASAAAPVVGSGCNGGSTTAHQTYFYWVEVRDASTLCTSDPSGGDTGYRGVAVSTTEYVESAVCGDMIALIAISVALSMFRRNQRICRRPE
jgi:hypothetical protein